MKLSCHEMMLGDRPLTEKFRLAREAGFDGVDLRGDLLQGQVAEAARLVRETGVMATELIRPASSAVRVGRGGFGRRA